ncbi:cell death abnormality protein 1-like isoform X2 [Dermacentor albipictus]|uniref:cell death abnormality protein 1-like isoform X2 n=1 Tax=Dermacentor albipictus TaxID=60249 RepID=UPI0038FCD7B2
MFASSRMDLGGRTASASLSYTLPNGTLLVNATIVITPFSYTGDTFCENNWDCRRFMNNCTDGRCECGAGNRFQSRELYCTKLCKDKADCAGGFGSRNLECLLGKCTCIVGTVLVGGVCGYPRGCIEDSTCTSGSICEDTRCVCPAGSLGVGTASAAVCERHVCTTDADCGFWLHAHCARIRPGSTLRGCRCAKDTALLLGSCNPIDNLGPCPYGRCATEYSECDPDTSLCRCQKGYELRIYGNTWICEKQDTETVDRACMESTQCYPGEVCDDGFCKCPKGKELSRELVCVEIKLPKTSTNLRLFLWLSAAMLALIVVFITFGGCLYLLAQRAENEQMEIAKMFEPPEEVPS